MTIKLRSPVTVTPIMEPAKAYRFEGTLASAMEIAAAFNARWSTELTFDQNGIAVVLDAEEPDDFGESIHFFTQDGSHFGMDVGLWAVLIAPHVMIFSDEQFRALFAPVPLLQAVK